MAVHLAVACDVYDGVFLCCAFSHEVSCNKILNFIQFLRVFLPTLSCGPNVSTHYRIVKTRNFEDFLLKDLFAH